MEKYSIDNAGTGNKREDLINVLILEKASDYAEHRAQKDWEADDRPENFYIEDEDGSMRMNAEAQEIFDAYYDEETESLYNLVNKVIQIDTPTEEEVAIERLGHYISEDDIPTAYKILLDASEEFGDRPADDYILMWEAVADRYTVNELLAEL